MMREWRTTHSPRRSQHATKTNEHGTNPLQGITSADMAVFTNITVDDR
jgi:hypothetical protein